MKSLLALSCLALGLAASPAFAQTATKTAPSTAAMTPTKEQCKAGYKADFQQSLKMSKAQFDEACAKMADHK